MNATVAQLINEQINKEFYSAYLYLDFANYYAAAVSTALKTGTACRRRRSATTRCCFPVPAQ